MRNEMDLLNMDERQRLAWFMANRGTLIAVGAVWLAMIGWELVHGRSPGFLMVMVPVFALLRGGLYLVYSSRPFIGEDSARDPSAIGCGKAAAALLLAAAIFLPIYSVAGAPGEGVRFTYTWGLARNYTSAVIPLALTYLWPALALGLARLESRRRLQLAIQFAEPLLAVGSCVILLWIPQLVFETRRLFFILMIPVNPSPALGCYVAVAANGLYLVSWLAGVLRPWSVQGD